MYIWVSADSSRLVLSTVLFNGKIFMTHSYEDYTEASVKGKRDEASRSIAKAISRVYVLVVIVKYMISQ